MRTTADAVRRAARAGVGWAVSGPGRSRTSGVRAPGGSSVRAPGRWRAWRRWSTEARDAGMATAEYAIVTVAAVGFAGLLILVLRSDEVRGLLLGIIRGALSV